MSHASFANNRSEKQSMKGDKINMKQTYKPGETAPCSCDYMVINANGTEISRNITVEAGESFPPTPGRNQLYVEQ